jgi:hypothetical protein
MHLKRWISPGGNRSAMFLFCSYFKLVFAPKGTKRYVDGTKNAFLCRYITNEDHLLMCIQHFELLHAGKKQCGIVTKKKKKKTVI